MKKIPTNLLTIYGRKPVQEALQNSQINFFRLHLADSNRREGIISDIVKLAGKRNIEIVYHDRLALSRISKNKKQDQGVAADIVVENFQSFNNFIENGNVRNVSLLALENVTNPQNLGMIIRSACAGYLDGILLPQRGCAKLDSLVIKASAGTLFKARIFTCDHLGDALEIARSKGFSIYGLATENSTSIEDIELNKPNILVLGNESEGISTSVAQLCDKNICIPMRNGVESLNVVVVAGVLSFMALFRK